MRHTIPYVAAGVAACAVGGVIIYVESRPHSEADHPITASVADGAATIPPSSFCAEGFETLADDACFASTAASSSGLVVYLHGRYSQATADEELDRQARVAKMANARGYSVLALRGVMGECTADDYKDFFCWPSNAKSALDVPPFIARMTPFVELAKSRVHGSTFLLGFSNGAYFAAVIAMRALVSFDAIAIAHGGPVNDLLDADAASGPAHIPLLLVTADDDASDPDMQSLDAELTRRQWAHEMIAREGGHALPDWDIEKSLTFFSRTRSEKLPLNPPLARRESHHVVEASTDSNLESDASADETDQ